MRVLKVGGAVRDSLLGLPVSDRDWVVIGGTVAEMLQRGFKQVGQDFPVFLHPQTGEEYALARTERKVAPGYGGFDIHATADVTLEEDLLRRDLTINAMAENEQGGIIDPYGGQQDLHDKILRHVSDAFAEDPLRILRVARFAARFFGLGFSIAPDTMLLMKNMVEAGEVQALVAERVWVEVDRALGEAHPEVFFTVLRECGALKILMPELDNLFGVPQPEQHHPEIDTGVHTMMVLMRAAALSQEKSVRFAALLHDLGKGLTDKDQWPKHHGHEGQGVRLVLALCLRLKVPNEYRDLAVLVARYHAHCHRAEQLKSSTLLDTLLALDVIRRPERLERFLLACQADAQGRKGFEQVEYPQADIFRRAYKLIREVDVAPIIASGKKGEKFAEALRSLRLLALK